MKSKDADNAPSTIPRPSVAKFLQHLEARAWTEAEKELDIIKQKSENSPWSRGYVKALEGLLLTKRSNDDKYLYLPKALENRTEEAINSLRNNFVEFASNELHGDYDRGYFKALEEYLGLVGTVKPELASNKDTAASQTLKEADKTEYSEELS